MPRIWKLAATPSTTNISGIPSAIARILVARGIQTPLEVEEFLTPEYGKLHDPFLFMQMEKVVERMWQAIQAGQRIAVYGDYDADAVTANALVQHALKSIGVQVESYVPDRFTEGYGLNIAAFEQLRDRGVKVVITVDCGTNSVDVAEFCKTNGIDLIITDHHEITGLVPDAFALINPKNPNEQYPDNQITGVGVAYKFVCGLFSNTERTMAASAKNSGTYSPGWEKWLLDLVSIGTVADCHSLLGENRILVSFGLKVLAKTKWVGLKALLEASGAEPPFTSKTLGFLLAPRINAAGRLEHANAALHLLMAEDPVEARRLAQDLEEINVRRQGLTQRAVSEATEKALFLQDKPILLLTDPSWSKGIVGLVAARIAELHKKPTIVLEEGEVEATGSARSQSGFNIIDALQSAKHILMRFGGHAQAAGLTVETKRVPELYGALLSYIESQGGTPTEQPALIVDAELTGSDLNLQFMEEVNKLQPFGFGNPGPIFALRDVEVLSVRAVGKEAKHVQLRLLMPGASDALEVIAFNYGHLATSLAPGDHLHVAGELQIDTWQGRQKLKLRMIDYKKATEPFVV
jgi:single-stranded-DNA-specific exonuclease